MTQAIKIQMGKPIRQINVINESGFQAEIERIKQKNDHAQKQQQMIMEEHKRAVAQMEAAKHSLEDICASLKSAIDKMEQIHDQAVGEHKNNICGLCIGIVERILKAEISKNNYDIEKIILETLSQVPNHQECVIKLNPKDIAFCEELIRNNNNSRLRELIIQPDSSIRQASCRVETSAGITDYFIDEHLREIEEKLQMNL